MAWQFYVAIAMVASGSIFMGLLGYRAAEALGKRMTAHRGRHAEAKGIAVAAERFARGEISEEEYRKIKSILAS